MIEATTEQKKLFRKQCRQVRTGLSEAERVQASLEICAKIEHWTVFQRCATILTYMPMKSEVDLRPLLECFPQKRWVLPRIAPQEGHSLYFHPYDSQRLVRHPFGMEEPAPDLPGVCPDEIQLALVPGLAFDRHGWRLGYGGGYYDRFLKDFCGTTLGIVFQALLFDKLPHTEHDIPMQWLVSENGIFSASTNKSMSLHPEVIE